jgi:hypothetical protein
MNMYWLFWILMTVCLVELLTSWLFRRRIRDNYRSLALFFKATGEDRLKDAATWLAIAKDPAQPKDARYHAAIVAANAQGCASTYLDVAIDIDHFMVNGKSLESRREIKIDEASNE